MVCLGDLADIELMVFRSDVVENSRAIVDFAVNQLLETVGRGNQYF